MRQFYWDQDILRSEDKRSFLDLLRKQIELKRFMLQHFFQV